MFWNHYRYIDFVHTVPIHMKCNGFWMFYVAKTTGKQMEFVFLDGHRRQTDSEYSVFERTHRTLFHNVHFYILLFLELLELFKICMKMLWIVFSFIFQLCPLESDSPEPSPKSHWIPIVDRWSGNNHRSRRAYGGESQPNPTINPLQQEMHCTTGSVLYNISRMLQWEMPFRALR